MNFPIYLKFTILRIPANRVPQFTHLHLTMIIIEKLFPFIIECTLYLLYTYMCGCEREKESIFPFFSILAAVYGPVNLPPSTTIHIEISNEITTVQLSVTHLHKLLVRKSIPKVFGSYLNNGGLAHISMRLRQDATTWSLQLSYIVHGCGVVYKLVKKRNFESIFFCISIHTHTHIPIDMLYNTHTMYIF